MIKDNVVAFDFETSGLEFWKPEFRVYSCAFAYRTDAGELKTKIAFGEGEIKRRLDELAKFNVQLVCHNAGFEYGVTKFKFPGHEDLIAIDTMRLCQVYDNGGTEEDDRGRFGLVKCVQRVLPEEPNHKEPAYRWIRENLSVKAGQEGRHISQLPQHLLESYNIADAVLTLRLYETTTTKFKEIGYDWRLDHALYMNITKHISMAKARGILVNFDQLLSYKYEIEREIEQIDTQFNEYFKDHIAAIEAEKKEAWILGPKTERGQAARRAKADENESIWRFKPKSKLDLQRLLVEKQNVTPTFHTPKGSPSFAAAHIHSYGEGGKLLANRNKRLLVHKQVSNLLALSAENFRYHPDLKSTGTKTGRMAGGEVV